MPDTRGRQASRMSRKSLPEISCRSCCDLAFPGVAALFPSAENVEEGGLGFKSGDPMLLPPPAVNLTSDFRRRNPLGPTAKDANPSSFTVGDTISSW